MPDFSNTYGRMLDDELLNVAKDAESLCPEARSALSVELRKRGLEVDALAVRQQSEAAKRQAAEKRAQFVARCPSLSRRLASLWPDVIDPKGARFATRQAFWAAIFCSGVTCVFAIASGVVGKQILGIDVWGLVDAVLFGIIALGIYRYSRLASLAGFAFYVLGRAYTWTQYGPQNPVLAAIFTLAFINGVRGCFAHHELLSSSLPSPDDSSLRAKHDSPDEWASGPKKGIVYTPSELEEFARRRASQPHNDQSFS